MATAQKTEIVDELKGRFGSATAVYVLDYQGITVEKLTGLRRSFRKSDSELKIVKNTLSRIAASAAGVDGLVQYLKGPTALVICPKDAVGPAKALNEFVKQHKDVVKIKGGIVEGQAITAKGVEQMASIPSREVLLAMMLGALQSPVAGFVGTLSGVLRKYVGTLDAIAKKKEQSN